MTIFSAWHWYMDDDSKWHVTPFFRSWSQHDVDDLRVESLDLDLSLGAAGSLTVVLRPSNACYDAFTKFRSYIVIYRDGKDIIWAGRVIKESKDLYNAYTVEAEGLLAQFNDCLVPTPSKDSDGNRYITKTIQAWVDYIVQINKNTDAMSGLPANGLRRISAGNIAGGSNSYTLSASSPTKAIDVLQNIQDEFAGYFIIRIVNKETEGIYPYLDFVLDETSANSQASTSEAQESKSTGNWPYWVYSQSGWEVSTLGNWTVTVNRPVGSDYATVTGTIQMMSPGGQSAAWSVVVTVNGTSYTYSDSVKGYGNGTYVHAAGKYYTLSKSFQIPVSADAGSLSGTIKFQCVGVSGLYKSASWNIKYDAKTKSDTSEIGRPVKASITFAENMLSMSQESSGDEIYTVLEPYGATPEDSDDPINISSVNGGKLYVTSSNIKEFGAIATTKTFDDIEDPSELLAAAKKEVEKLSKSKVTLSFDAIDLHDIDDVAYDAFNIGDKIKVNSAPNNINDYFTIKTISYKLSDSGSLHPSITMEEEKNGYVSKTWRDTKKYKNELDTIKTTYISNKELQKNIAEVVTSVVYDYALSSDKNNPPLDDSSYNMTMPERQMGYYIWMRTRTYKGYSSSPSDVTYACITGDKGDQGDAAAPIYTCVITSSNGQTFVNGNVSTTLTAKVLKGSVEDGETSFTWSRFTDDTTADAAWNVSHSAKSKSIEITAEDFGSRATFYASTTHAEISLSGSIDLVDLTDTTTYIYYSDGTNITTTPTAASIKIGIYTGIPISGGQPAIPPSGTQWATFKGADGSDSYFHVRYSNDGGKTFCSWSTWTTANTNAWAEVSKSTWHDLKTGTITGDWMGYYSDNDPIDSDDVTKYTWIKVKGDQGEKGISVTGVTLYYVATSQSTGVARTSNPSDSQWTLDPNSYYATISSTKPFLWTYQKVTLSDGSIIYTEPNITGTFGDFITATTYQYMITSTDTPPSESSTDWSTAQVYPTVLKKYAWVKITNTYFSGSVISHVELLVVYGGDGSNIIEINAKYCAVGSEIPNIDSATWYDDINTAISNGTGNTVFSYLTFVYENGKTSHMYEPINVYSGSGKVASIMWYFATGTTNDRPATYTDFPTGWQDARWYTFSTDTASKVALTQQYPFLFAYCYVTASDGTITCYQPYLVKTNGAQIKQMIRQYYLSTSSTEITGSEWSDIVPVEIPDGKYVWSRLALLYDSGWSYTDTQYMADVTYLATKIYEVNDKLVETYITKSEFNSGLAQTVQTSTYNEKIGSIEQRISSVEQTANDVALHFGEDGDYTKHFSFSDAGMEIKSGNASDIKCVIDNDSFAFVDKNGTEQLTLTASGAVLHSAKIDTVLQFANESTNTTDWRIHETPSRALAFDWIGG